MEFLLGFDFVVGTRIHGAMLGLQAGIPSLCIAHDSRTREMCEVMQVPFVMAADVRTGTTLSDLLGRFRFDARSFDENRRMLADRLNEFPFCNGLRASVLLGKIRSDESAVGMLIPDSFSTVRHQTQSNSEYNRYPKIFARVQVLAVESGLHE
jgi:polysaccharide pyruvyl transferase WcaK-like protein